MNELTPPRLAKSHPKAIEILRAWSAPDECQQVTLRTHWSDPGAWGLMLVDIARHAANAYEREGFDRNDAIQRIGAAFNAEWDFPTDEAVDLADADE